MGCIILILYHSLIRNNLIFLILIRINALAIYNHLRSCCVFISIILMHQQILICRTIL